MESTHLISQVSFIDRFQCGENPSDLTSVRHRQVLVWRVPILSHNCTLYTGFSVESSPSDLTSVLNRLVLVWRAAHLISQVYFKGRF